MIFFSICDRSRRPVLFSDIGWRVASWRQGVEFRIRNSGCPRRSTEMNTRDTCGAHRYKLQHRGANKKIAMAALLFNIRRVFAFDTYFACIKLSRRKRRVEVSEHVSLCHVFCFVIKKIATLKFNRTAGKYVLLQRKLWLLCGVVSTCRVKGGGGRVVKDIGTELAQNVHCGEQRAMDPSAAEEGRHVT